MKNCIMASRRAAAPMNTKKATAQQHPPAASGDRPTPSAAQHQNSRPGSGDAGMRGEHENAAAAAVAGEEAGSPRARSRSPLAWATSAAIQPPPPPPDRRNRSDIRSRGAPAAKRAPRPCRHHVDKTQWRPRATPWASAWRPPTSTAPKRPVTRRIARLHVDHAASSLRLYNGARSKGLSKSWRQATVYLCRGDPFACQGSSLESATAVSAFCCK